MTTLEDIAFTFVGGSVVGVVSVCAFGCAVRSRSTAIALRAEARPKETIYTAHPVSASQQRGSPMLGWIPWTLSLSYDTMLNGIPGTGTREKGLSGLMLNVNLDGIVLLRFQAICLRVCGTATALFVMIAIPAYLSAQCYTRTEDNGQGCGGNEYNLTNYERTTLANVPTIYGTFSNSTDSSLPGGGGGHASSPLRTVVHANHGILWRLYAVVFCFWIVAIHLCRLLHAEWVQILAMRRVYYLEYDIWGSRREELHKTIYCDADETDAGGGSGDADKTAERGGPSQDDDFDDLFTGHDDNDGQGSLPAGTATKRVAFDSARTKPLKSASAMAESNGNDGSVGGVDIRKKEPHLYRREPWIPHPEQRDTVPHVAVYSILVGGLPSLPGQAADSFNADTTLQFSKRESIDWQLSLTTTFFDHCVPNQPGFSSSIAAVTIIPGALDLSVAWRKWYAAAAKLRRLRFLRDQIQKRRYFDIEAASSEEKAAHIDVDIYGYGDSNDSGYGDSAKNNDDRDSAKDYGYGDPSEKDYEYGSRNSDNDEVYVPANASESEVASYLANGKNAVHNFDMGGAKTKLFHQKALKAATGGESDTHIYDSMEFGPEQAAVYAREFALAAAPCCPNGCNEGRIRRAPIEELVELERIASIEVHQANLELREARRRATRTDTFTAMRNLHDQQSGQESKVARVVGASMNAASANSGISGATVMPKFVPPKTVVEEDIYNDDSLDAAELAEAIQNLPMISRYDRRGSANNDDANIQKFDRPSTQQIAERLELAVPSDLDLEAQLFKKATDDRSHLPVKKDNNSNKTMRQLMKGSEFKAAVSRRRVPNKTGMPQIPNKTGMPQCIPETEGFEHDSNASLPFNFIKKATGNESIRRRKPNIGAPVTENPVSSKDKEMHCADNSSSAQWAQVETLITEANESTPTPRTLTGGQRDCANGTWQGVSSGWMFSRTKVKPNNIKTWAKKQSKEAVSSLARESTYAVVTFTSRQAAVAARACLADGRGAGRWSTLKDMPIPPLSDAAPGDVITFRNCCRPVTLSINERQKNCRHYFAIALLGFMYVFYTVPLTFASQLADPKTLNRLFPGADELTESTGLQLTQLLSGLVTASIWSTFFALCPIIFKFIAFFGSKATSVAHAEFSALQYYWWFMVITAFSGQLLATMGLKGLDSGLASGSDGEAEFTFESEFQKILREIADSIPSRISVSWLNWIIFRFTVTLPMNYLLQINSFVLSALGLNCCSRLVRGGGTGGPVPYRIYIDSGVVLMCTLALSPASPIVAPACFCYFLVCQPLMRRNLIYLYRPRFDGGGFRWPFIFDMCISALFVGEILLTVQMVLKQAAGPAAAAAISVIPTYLFRKATKERFLRSFEDAALLQTSLLDGWDTGADYSIEKREEFRQFLVDAHKAAYVPICLAGTDTDDFLTAEPAVVVRTEGDAFTESFQQVDEIVEMSESYRPSSPVRLPFSERRKTQQGVSLRRAVHQLSTPRVRTGSIDSQLYDQLNIDERAGISPFERSMSSRNMDQTVAHGSDWQSKANGSMTSLLSTVSKAKSLKSQASDGVSEPEDISERSGTNYSAKEITEVSCGTCMSLESRESKQNNLKTARC